MFLLGGFGALLSYYFTSPTREIDIEIQDVINEIDLFSFAGTAREQRAEKLFKVHEFLLKKYYHIFGIRIICGLK